MNTFLAKLRAIFRGPMSAPPQPQLEQKAGQGLSPDRLDAALRRLRENTPEHEEYGEE